jgi:hypothetical protein
MDFVELINKPMKPDSVVVGEHNVNVVISKDMKAEKTWILPASHAHTHTSTLFVLILLGVDAVCAVPLGC